MEPQAERLRGFSRHGLGRNEGITGLREERLPDTFPPLRPALPAGSGPKSARISSLTTQFSAHGIMIKTEARRQTQSTNVGYLFLLTCTVLSNFNDEPTHAN